LAYHNIVPDAAAPAGERSLHLPISRFREQLDALQRTHEIVTLAELIAPSRSSNRPLAAITFDDAYRGCLSLGLPELESRNVPGTVFVAPGLLGSAGCWWDRLAHVEVGTLAPEDRDHILNTLAGDTKAALEWVRSRGDTPADCPPLYGIATEGELQAAARRPGIRLGAHSWSHRNLSRLSAGELATELAPPLSWLRARFEDVAPWLAFPYGLHSPEAIGEAHRAGYEVVLRVNGGWTRSADVTARNLPRLNVPSGLTTDRFMLKTRGIIPL